MGKVLRDIIIIFIGVVIFAVISVAIFFIDKGEGKISARVSVSVISAIDGVSIDNAKIHCIESGNTYLPNEEIELCTTTIGEYGVFSHIFVVEAQGYIKSVVYAFVGVNEGASSILTVNMFEDDGFGDKNAIPLVISPHKDTTQYIANSVNFAVD